MPITPAPIASIVWRASGNPYGRGRRSRRFDRTQTKGIETPVAAESGKIRIAAQERPGASAGKCGANSPHIRSHIRNRRLGDAIKHLKSRKYRDLLDETEIAVLYAQIAKGYFQLGHDERAFELASQKRVPGPNLRARRRYVRRVGRLAPRQEV